MRGHPRIDPARAAVIAEAARNIPPAPRPAPLDVDALRQYRDALIGLRIRMDRLPPGPVHFAWRTKKMASIVDGLTVELGEALRQVGAVR